MSNYLLVTFQSVRRAPTPSQRLTSDSLQRSQLGFADVYKLLFARELLKEVYYQSSLLSD